MHYFIARQEGAKYEKINATQFHGYLYDYTMGDFTIPVIGCAPEWSDKDNRPILGVVYDHIIREKSPPTNPWRKIP